MRHLNCMKVHWIQQDKMIKDLWWTNSPGRVESLPVAGIGCFSDLFCFVGSWYPVLWPFFFLSMLVFLLHIANFCPLCMAIVLGCVILLLVVTAYQCVVIVFLKWVVEYKIVVVKMQWMDIMERISLEMLFRSQWINKSFLFIFEFLNFFVFRLVNRRESPIYYPIHIVISTYLPSTSPT